MKTKLIQDIKCLFGYHEWDTKDTIYDPENTTRECRHCNKTQIVYKGDWHTIRRIAYGSIKKTYRNKPNHC